jgi:proteasome lid subunit RPN8/RPN11
MSTIIRGVGIPCQLVDGQERARAMERQAERLSFYPPEAVLLRNSDESVPAEFKVRLTTYAKRELLNELQRVRREAKRDIEVGGWLFSTQRPRQWDRLVEVCFCSWSGPGASSNRDSIRLGDLSRVREELPAHFHPVGSWHSHPDPVPYPSRTDAVNWAANLDKRPSDLFVGIIATPASEGGWMLPSLSAFVVQRSGFPSRPIVERASLSY